MLCEETRSVFRRISTTLSRFLWRLQLMCTCAAVLFIARNSLSCDLRQGLRVLSTPVPPRPDVIDL